MKVYGIDDNFNIDLYDTDDFKAGSKSYMYKNPVKGKIAFRLYFDRCFNSEIEALNAIINMNNSLIKKREEDIHRIEEEKNRQCRWHNNEIDKHLLFIKDASEKIKKFKK